jgi:3-hydroxyisobutyrate dehydrogenase
MRRSVALIGVGAMGGPMARRILAAGHELTVCDTSVVAVTALADAGARVAETPADCAAAEIVLIVVSTPQQVQDVIIGTRGVLAGMTQRRPPILVVMSTVSAEVLEGIAGCLPASARMIDAPISGGIRGAEQGTLTMLIGGDAAAIEEAGPVLDQLAGVRIHCGGLGTAQTMKILNNTVGVSIAVIASEVYRLAMERGVDPQRLSLVLEACSGRNARSKDPAGPKAGYRELARDRAAYAATGAIMRKDLGLAAEMASQAQGQYPAIRGLKALIEGLGDETYESWRRIAGLPSDEG